MGRGFVNLNRFKHAKMVKRDSKKRADLKSKAAFRRH
jgi:hypothetical protein